MITLRRLIHSPSALLAFEAAARLGSFTKAAEELSVTQAAISYSMRQLERALNVRLFARSHRRVSLTSPGRRFYQDVSIGLAHIRRSAEALRFEAEARHVTLSVSTAFANYWMVPRLAEFRARNPEIDIRLQTTDKDVDLLAEGIPLGVRRGHGDWEEYESAFLTEEIIYPIASMRYFEEHSLPQKAKDLLGHHLIHLEEPFRPRPNWTDWFRANGVLAPVRGEGLRLNDYALVVQAAMTGEGIAMGWHHIVAWLIDHEMLVRVTDGEYRDGWGFYVVWPRSLQLSEPAIKVRDWILKSAQLAPGA